MNVKQWAGMLNGREYLEELTGAEEKQAEADGVVIVFGQSDDLIEFRGVIDCEGGALGGALYRISSLKEAIREYHGKNPCLTLTDAQWKALPEIRAIWSPTSGGMPSWASWEMQSAIPHETFDIMEDGELYCRGIVFAWADAFPGKEAVADDSLYPVDRPVEPANRWENPEQWAYIADWEENRANRAEAALKEVWEKLYSIRGEPDKLNVMIMHEHAAIMGVKA